MSKDAPSATKFATFLKDKKVDPRRLLAVSHSLESLRPEDRTVRLAAKRARGAEGDKKPEGDKKKARSGRPVTPRSLEAAMGGKALSGPSKTRILRAVNAVLEQKKQEKVELKALF
jgi:hypothetical protein